jgi:DNA-binding PadR family transcriptional regulator
MSNEYPKSSTKEMKVLEILIANGEMFGLEMVEASSGDLKRGIIYVTLSRMCDKGYLDSREEPRTASQIGILRRKYWATGLGEKVYEANIRTTVFFSKLVTNFQ